MIFELFLQANKYKKILMEALIISVNLPVLAYLNHSAGQLCYKVNVINKVTDYGKGENISTN